ncbi:hypothetical protein EI94DRAFT_1818613 [Lactarius quietus]|nr:hypothetical protein EI94DRAFT_1818613 [Lactarius quietus]
MSAPSLPPPLPVMSPSPELEQAPTASRPTSPVDPHTDTDMLKVTNEHALEDYIAGEAMTESPWDHEPAPGAGTRDTRVWDQDGEASKVVVGGHDGHGSTTFFIDIIGGYYPPITSL